MEVLGTALRVVFYTLAFMTLFLVASVASQLTEAQLGHRRYVPASHFENQDESDSHPTFSP